MTGQNYSDFFGNFQVFSKKSCGIRNFVSLLVDFFSKSCGIRNFSSKKLLY